MMVISSFIRRGVYKSLLVAPLACISDLAASSIPLENSVVLVGL